MFCSEKVEAECFDLIRKTSPHIPNFSFATNFCQSQGIPTKHLASDQLALLDRGGPARTPPSSSAGQLTGGSHTRPSPSGTQLPGSARPWLPAPGAGAGAGAARWDCGSAACRALPLGNRTETPRGVTQRPSHPHQRRLREMGRAEASPGTCRERTELSRACSAASPARPEAVTFFSKCIHLA